ncbi:hypothetical protein GGR54DRAFT_34954 [Hypoxylon sp. NC1633]|nr:hypothetical protein GGR54DRAFT_34954 [Hypoxylon sp. NC1633]
MEAAFQSTINALMRYSKVDISVIRIGSVTDNSFHVSLEARASNTGPASATISPMTIELCGPEGSFGKMTLPELITAPGGAPITVSDQLVEITDKKALQAFITTIMRDKSATLSLKNGKAQVSVSAFRVKPHTITYERDIPMAGMNGPEVSIKSATLPSNPPASGGETSTVPSTGIGIIGSNDGSDSSSSQPGITVTIHVKNPSPVELSFGLCEFEIRNDKGEVFAQLKCRLDMHSKCFDTMFYGAADPHVSINEGTARLVGKKCAGADWCHETVRGIDVPIAGIWRVLQALGLEYEEPKPASSLLASSVSRWRGKFWKKGS